MTQTQHKERDTNPHGAIALDLLHPLTLDGSKVSATFKDAAGATPRAAGARAVSATLRATSEEVDRGTAERHGLEPGTLRGFRVELRFTQRGRTWGAMFRVFRGVGRLGREASADGKVWAWAGAGDRLPNRWVGVDERYMHSCGVNPTMGEDRADGAGPAYYRRNVPDGVRAMGKHLATRCASWVNAVMHDVESGQGNTLAVLLRDAIEREAVQAEDLAADLRRQADEAIQNATAVRGWSSLAVQGRTP